MTSLIALLSNLYIPVEMNRDSFLRDDIEASIKIANEN